MKTNLKNRSLLTLMDFTREEIACLLELSAKLKADKKCGKEVKQLCGKNIALIFEKDSTRTRCAFEVAAFDQGAHVTYLGATGSQMGNKESVADTARVLGRFYDGIQYRGFSQTIVEDLAKYSGVPVWNGLTDTDHPTQVLADFLTVQEHIKKPLDSVVLAYIGDGRNNMASALMIGAAKMGLDFRIVSPRELFPDPALVEKCKAVDGKSRITITNNIAEGVKGADILYTDVWVSMGEDKSVWEKRVKILKPYQVNMAMIRATGNDNVKFLHCLPAFHDTNTTIGHDVFTKYGLASMEVTDEVFESKYSVVFDQAENRMHTIKALMVATIK